MNLSLEICRFNPEVDREPYFQEFRVEIAGHQTVLDALLEAWRQDPGLSFRRSCRSAICGSCAVAINGTPRLACQTLIRDIAGDNGRITIQPLPHFRQLKDLVVDLEPLFDSLKAVVPWLITRPEHDGHMDPAVSQRMESLSSCILCGICDAAICNPGGTKPAAYVKGLRLAQDTRDVLNEARLRLMQVPPEILKLFIKKMPDVCPKKVKVPEI
ncbi:MAG TPA: 2Fe-2S iron-sulfur cluster-binding protein [Bacillota bacterium]|nr:2Fe-2S iron-sulfur cluster-binding protein [Peptococcaceae bacterium MAG4]NLW38119.1 succinate dehydrogenase/fumarate reductase iron-sulfur subunit [Peptococcaceae bacterium]HPZ43539.1 2Fe-2S iron-sulfur cluster-binding protein [Bacillota bacterium]HQD76060.1 2Fe-2S iron-sulfur cluster-binding protein [Bacillota bacterium]HUM58749.1 2Fe-2S iron-sulfur cluster-binding protein [Bacillota bacterium]